MDGYKALKKRYMAGTISKSELFDEIDRRRAEIEALKKSMDAVIKYAWRAGYEAGHDHTVEGEWGYAEERAADWFSDSMFSNWTQHLNSEGE